MDGDFVAGVSPGWNFGEGHLHNEQLLPGGQKRCHFEEGYVEVDDMLARQPWDGSIPFQPASDGTLTA